MRGRRAHQYAVAILVIPLLLLVGMGAAHATYRCRYDRVVRQACCCPKAPAAVETASRAARIERACCCDVEAAKAMAAPAGAPGIERVDLTKLAAPAVVVAIELVAPPVEPAFERAPDIDAAPPPHPPIILLKRSFLL